MSTVDVISQFLQSSEPRALAIQGGWGRGKTHLWKHLIRMTRGIHWTSYSYVSLFGVNSLDELKMAIFEKGTSPSRAHLPESVVSFDTEVSELPKIVEKNWKTMASNLFRTSLPGVGNIGVLYNALVFSQVRRRLICIDDLERRGHALEIKDVLGLITLLCEERMCSVALIFNEETLSPEERAEWRKHREKVFHGEVSYQPSCDDCLDLVLEPKGDNAWHDAARIALARLQITNIRIITRVRNTLDLIVRECRSTVSFETIDRISNSVVALTYCHNASGDGAPTLDFALSYSHMAALFASKDEMPSDQERAWGEILDSMEFYPEEVDRVIADLVVHGYPDKQRLRGEIEQLEKKAGKAELESAMRKAWGVFHDGWKDNKDEVIAAFKESFPPVVAIIDAMNADSAISLMRELGEDALADEFMNLWISCRIDRRRSELSLSDASFFRPLTDKKFKERIVELQSEQSPELAIEKAMAILASRSGDTELAIRAVARTGASEVLQWARNSHGRTFADAVKYLFGTYGGRDFVPEAKAIIGEVLREMAKDSRLLALRIRSLGVTVDELEHGAADEGSDEISADEDE